MGLKVLTKIDQPVIYPGMEIDYIVRPWAGITLKCITILGDAVHWVFVENRIKEFLNYRRQALEKIFHDHVSMGY